MRNKLVLVLASVLLVFTACKKEFTITVTSDNEKWGSVTGGGTFAKGTEIKIKATPKASYKFTKWDDDNTDNPRTIVVKKDASYTAIFEKKTSGGGDNPSGGDDPVQEGFSVSATTKVLFSPGNLQWSANNGGSTATTHIVAGGGTAAGTWRFAPNQWDTIGANNENISSTYSGWIDLFGWGTSGYNSKYPYMTSTTNSDYGNGTNNISGTNYDWGVYNEIYNSKTQTTDAPGTWRTLTDDEWNYLINIRTTSSGIRYAKAKVNGVTGLILVPDNWSTATYNLNSTNTSSATYTTNVITSTQWTSLENAGCVFLPAAGYRSGTSVNVVGSYGFYWSATCGDSYYAYYLYFYSGYVYTSSYYRCYGQSVRLVRSAE